jgi:predicted cobalt transporter CbtA
MSRLLRSANSQKVQTGVGFVLYVVAAGTLAGAWSNLVDFNLWMFTGFGLLMMMPANPTRLAAILPLVFLLGAPWLAGFWR